MRRRRPWAWPACCSSTCSCSTSDRPRAREKEKSPMASLLLLTVFLPLVGSGFLLLSPRLPARTARAVALGAVLATLAASLVLLAGFDPEAKGPQFAYE